MNKLNTKKAFTIIEVVLVLAVAGLILLAVLIAIPAMNRSKRNQIRRDDMARFMKAIVSYQSSHSGKPPIYFDPDGVTYNGGPCTEGERLGKQCYRINSVFIEKYLGSDLLVSNETNGKPGAQQGGAGWLYLFKCEDGGNCEDFTDPQGNLYGLKAEGPAFSGGDEYYNKPECFNSDGSPKDGVCQKEQLFDFDNVVHIAIRSKCSSLGATDGKGNGSTSSTKSDKDVTITYRLESNDVFCIDNQ